jgi:predicted MPP superfamily phosphohydrolase
MERNWDRCMYVAAFMLILLSLIGHGALWIGINNRWHGIGLARKVIKTGSLVLYAILFGLPLAVYMRLAYDRASAPAVISLPFTNDWAAVYLGACAIWGTIQIPFWAFRRWQQSTLPKQVRHTNERVLNIAASLGRAPTRSARTRLFCRLPYNHLWEVHVSEFKLGLAALPPELDGLTICHLSDLHFSHRIERDYFDEIVRLANATKPDLVALTGDVCDRCDRIPWIMPVLGALEARIAKFSVLGNHDLRTGDVPRVREALAQAGFCDVGGQVSQVGNLPMVVAGNELPWFPFSVPMIETLPVGKLRLLLSHSPDQFAWAQRCQFDLMLAGHTHGGQVRFPLLGPLVCPSLHGTKYASGFFKSGPTLLHVSRGTGSLFPYRLNCRPQVAKLVLCRTL